MELWVKKGLSGLSNLAYLLASKNVQNMIQMALK